MIDNPAKAVVAKCPFYLRTQDSGKPAIQCESFIVGGNIKLAFPDKSSRDNHFYAMCAYCYEACCIYAMLVRKYDDRNINI